MRIDLDLIKKKSEHNEGLIEELEEIALHQLQIRKIEFINIHCKNLKILLLQSNLIEKIENLNQLKKLEYLNLALNNITVIENLEKCESLRKLDLTLNFIDISTIEKSINNLKNNENLKELYLMGNPCSNWKYLKFFIIFKLEQLEVLDGCDILMSDKIKSKQIHKIVLESLEEEIKMYKLKEKDSFDSINNRIMIYEEIEKENELEKKKNENKEKDKKDILPIYTDEGEIRQCNEGHYKFVFDEYSNKKFTFLKLFLPKYLCNSLIKIDINVNYVRCVIKNKLFQIKLNDPILTDFTKIVRKKYTGELHVKMRKKNYKKNKIIENECFKEDSLNVFSDSYKNHLHCSSSSSYPCSSNSTSSSDSSSNSFFKNESSFKEIKKRNTIKPNLALHNKNEDTFFFEEKQTKYLSPDFNKMPSLEKISKINS
ncbi:leucine-rich repeat protein, putative [Plasmodium relictum]|uniref:Leucine-rich repeat protein, putative n=1 Tax=Plasmodium relictum TaxID=85471 RepID=A0A1J1HBM6_PLARL|nr:leucine-rich repeat protein, putative [Plasmodium relictum]CRH02703.1 leucine-rich repeat protein, putative [Plasmodium relictum]